MRSDSGPERDFKNAIVFAHLRIKGTTVQIFKFIRFVVSEKQVGQ